MIGKIIVAIALIVVALTLFAGISTLWMGDKVSNKWSNRLMRYRVLAQFVAIIIILTVLYFSSGH